MLCSSLVCPYSLICSFFLFSVFSFLLFSFSAIVYPLSDSSLSFCLMQDLTCRFWHSADSITRKRKIMLLIHIVHAQKHFIITSCNVYSSKTPPEIKFKPFMTSKKFQDHTVQDPLQISERCKRICILRKSVI